ncbi:MULTISPECIES: SDR family oxidoreductase [unclassified Aureispira]|uniref:SDR family NAD(P)-dependent oxidoreductase n=1 Tax=unclassified Aureispira TaxID=2649989 RepID=UPI0006970DAC|nr:MULTISPECIES: SDR family oxidoreductase [unclassified Aureispira]WMX14456.1 SDR family oxidoreductase [Aureispira sp. CCB-E]
MALKSIFNLKNKKQDLRGKYVLITGAAQGIGLKTAHQFAAAGSHLILTDINEEKLALAKVTLRKYKDIDVQVFKVDVSSKKAVQEMADTIRQRIGRIDILVNNAGIGHQGSMEDTSLKTWKRLIDINLWGPLYHIYAFLPMMKAQGSGQIVNVSSGQAFFRLPTWGAYAAIKLAMGAVSEILHYELQQYNIKVTTVYPYMVNTGFYKDVEAETLGTKLSMKLLPLYSQKPETVAKTIFKAVEKGKRIEMVNVLNNMAKGLHFFNPVSNIFSKTVNFALNSSNRSIKNSPVMQSVENLVNLLTNISYGALGEVGFKMEEVMSGEHEFVKGKQGKLPMEFKVVWGTENLVDWANPFGEDFMCNTLSGTVTIGGLCENAPCRGRLELKYFTEQKIRYTFYFQANGESYEFIGEKRNIYPWNLPFSHTCCFGELRKVGSNKVLSNSITHFHWDTLPAFLGSFELLRDAV